MKEKLKKTLLQIFGTKIGWLFVSLFLTVIFGVLSNFYDWAEIPMFISLIYPVGLSLVMIVYAWIITQLMNKKIKVKNDLYIVSLYYVSCNL